MASQRLLQINDLLRQHVNDFIAKELEVPVEYFITLSKVDTAPDLRAATIYLTVIPDNKRGTALKLLRHSVGGLRKYIAVRMKIRFTPRITFAIDGQVVYGNEIDELLDSLKTERLSENNENT